MPFEPNQRKQNNAAKQQRRFHEKRAKRASGDWNSKLYREAQRKSARTTKAAQQSAKSNAHQLASSPTNPAIRYQQRKLQSRHHHHSQGLLPVLVNASVKWGIPLLVAWIVVEGLMAQGVQAKPTGRRRKDKDAKPSFENAATSHNQTRTAPGMVSDANFASPSTTSSLRHLAESVYVAMRERFTPASRQNEPTEDDIDTVQMRLREHPEFVEQLQQIKDGAESSGETTEIVQQYVTVIADKVASLFSDKLTKPPKNEQPVSSARSQTLITLTENSTNDRNVLTQKKANVVQKPLHSARQNVNFESVFDVSMLDGTNGFQIDGSYEREGLGSYVSGAGDINADGTDDIIIAGTNKIYVVFGSGHNFTNPFSTSMIDGTNGFLIDTNTAGTSSGGKHITVGRAGDINHDGIDDLVIGIYWPAANVEYAVGEGYVVFGSTRSFANPFKLSALNGNNGFRIQPIASSDCLGSSVNGAGDVNGDRIDDIVIGAKWASPHGKYRSGESYVIFGSANGFASTFKLSILDGNNGFRINGISAKDQSGYSVDGAGDINGDGVSDIIIGAPIASRDRGDHIGESYIVFGNKVGFARVIELSALDGINGFKINAIDETYSSSYCVTSYLCIQEGNTLALIRARLFGISVSSAGDINNDGISDIIIGTADIQVGEITDSHPVSHSTTRAYVLFGSNHGFLGSIDLSDLNATNGFKINSSISPGDMSMWQVSGIGDVNGDNVDDIIIGGRFTYDMNGEAHDDKMYVVFGNASDFNSPLELSKLDKNQGFLINIPMEKIRLPPESYQNVASGIGDVNGDGIGDIIIGASQETVYKNSESLFWAGRSYVLFGKALPPSPSPSPNPFPSPFPSSSPFPSPSPSPYPSSSPLPSPSPSPFPSSSPFPSPSPSPFPSSSPFPSPSPSPFPNSSPFPSPSPSPFPSSSPFPSPSPSPFPSSSPFPNPFPSPSPTPTPIFVLPPDSFAADKLIIEVAVVGSALLVFTASGLLFCYCRKPEAAPNDDLENAKQPLQQEIELGELAAIDEQVVQQTDDEQLDVQDGQESRLYAFHRPSDAISISQVSGQPTDSHMTISMSALESNQSMPLPLSSPLQISDEEKAVLPPSEALITILDREGLLILPEQITESRLLGHGGFGEVMLGDWDSTQVAVKRLLSMRKERNLEDDFQREVITMHRLNHPHVLQLLGVTIEPGKYCLVTEYMCKGSLHDVLSNKADKINLSNQRNKIREQIGFDIARGLSYLHSRKPIVLHRDLKSQNVLLGENYRAKLGDFGLAFAKDGSQQAGRAGTKHWMALELLQPGKDSKASLHTEKSDIYSLGLLFWVLMTSKITPPPPAKLWETLSTQQADVEEAEIIAPQLSEVTRRCCQQQPGGRPTAIQVVSLFRDIRKHSQTESHQPHWSTSPSSLFSSADSQHRVVHNHPRSGVTSLTNADDEINLSLQDTQQQSSSYRYDINSESNTNMDNQSNQNQASGYL